MGLRQSLNRAAASRVAVGRDLATGSAGRPRPGPCRARRWKTGPARTTMWHRPRKHAAPGGSAANEPPMPTGRIGTSALAAMRARTGLMASRWPRARAGALGGHGQHPAGAQHAEHAANAGGVAPDALDGDGAPLSAGSSRSTGTRNISALTTVAVFGNGSSTISGGTSSRLAWLRTTSSGPRGGMCSAPMQPEVVVRKQVQAQDAA